MSSFYKMLATAPLLALSISISTAQTPAPAPVAPAAAAEGPVPSAETARELDALAGKTALPSGARIVCLGDSITITNARQTVKYPEMIGQALAKKQPGKIEVFNAGKGGCNVQMALDNVETNVIARRPTLVFINMGVNDSKLVAPDHQRNQVPLDKFTAAYRELIKTIKAKTGAECVVVGTVACADEVTKAIAMGGPKKKTYFGNPEQLKKYNSAAQAIAKEMGCDYVDLFDCFMAQPDIKALFPGDGVHANQKGQELIALQLMRYLAGKYPAK